MALAGSVYTVSVRPNWETTIGNNTSAYGDFVGAGSLQAIITAAIAAFGSVWSISVFLKSGIDVNIGNGVGSSITVPAGCVLTVHGSGSDPTGPSSKLNVTGGGGFYVQGTIILKNVYVHSDAGESPEPLAIVEGTGAAFLMDDVRVHNTYVVWRRGRPVSDAGGYRSVWRGCTFTPGSYAGAPLSFNVQSGDMGSLTLLDCALFGAVDRPLAAWGANANTGWMVLKYERCNFRCAGNVNALSTVNNSGVLSIYPGTATNPARLNVSYIDCDVYAFAANTPVLMYLADPVSGVGGFNNGTFVDIVISGGRWMAEANARTGIETPFYIGPKTWGSSFINVRTALIENVTVGWGDIAFEFQNSIVYGNAPADLSYSGDVNAWAAFTVYAQSVTVRNIRFGGGLVNSNTADFAILGLRSCDVELVDCTNLWGTGLGIAPTGRFIISPTTDFSNKQNATYSKIVYGNFPTVTQVTRPDGGVLFDQDNPQTAVHYNQGWVISYCTVNLPSGIQHGNGIRVGFVGGFREIDHCVLYGALGADGNGVLCNQLANNPQLIVKDCRISSWAQYGIVVATNDWANGSVEIASNEIDNCQLYGIVAVAGTWSGNVGPRILNNRVKGNFFNYATTYPFNPVQISVGTTGVNNTCAVILGNDCGGIAGAAGGIEVLSSSVVWLSGMDMWNGAGYDTPIPVTIAATPLGGTQLRQNNAVWRSGLH